MIPTSRYTFQNQDILEVLEDSRLIFLENYDIIRKKMTDHPISDELNRVIRAMTGASSWNTEPLPPVEEKGEIHAVGSNQKRNNLTDPVPQETVPYHTIIT